MARIKEQPFVTADKKRGAYLAVYDMQGGPLPSEIEFILSKTAERIKDLYPGIAINTSVE